MSRHGTLSAVRFRCEPGALEVRVLIRVRAVYVTVDAKVRNLRSCFLHPVGPIRVITCHPGITLAYLSHYNANKAYLGYILLGHNSGVSYSHEIYVGSTS